MSSLLSLIGPFNLTDLVPHLTVAAMLELLAIVVFIPWILMTKRNSTSAVAWCLVVLLMPFLGVALFWVFGYSHITGPLRRKKKHRAGFRLAHPSDQLRPTYSKHNGDPDSTWGDLGHLATRVHAFPLRHGNRVTLYHETQQAYDAILEAIRSARQHVHLEYFILRADETGKRLLDLLIQKAKGGVEVRLLYDAMGGRSLSNRFLRPLVQAGGKVEAFLPLNPLRSRIQINLRNHRKMTVVDGKVAFTGGMNIGNEYLGKDGYFGYWRDEMMKLEGPAVADLHRVFVEDWDFALGETLVDEKYFPELEPVGEEVIQVAESGPDQEVNCIREIFFAAILAARERLWIASPYFVPDDGLLDALRLARYRGVDVRLLSLLRPDHYLSFYAGRSYWTDMLAVGVKVYQYARGMMHSKMMMVDGQWAMLGSANMDNRSLHLNFEAGCAIHSASVIAEMEQAYLKDLEDSILLEKKVFALRSFWARLVENGCRLFSPML